MGHHLLNEALFMGHHLLNEDGFRELVTRGRIAPDTLRHPLAKQNGSVEKARDGSSIFILSTATPDRSNDVVSQDGWVLDPYRKNPVVLWAHDHDAPPVARSPNTYVDGQGRLVSDSPIFAKQDENAFGAMVGKMVDAGLLNAASVGFIPLEWSWAEKRGDFAMDFKRQELIEWSIVPVPANSEALVGNAKAKGIDLAPMLAWTSKALDEKREFPTFSRAELETVYKGLGQMAVHVDVARALPHMFEKDMTDATVCACEAGPLVKCQECGGHKRCMVSPDSKSFKEAPGGQEPVKPHLCDCDAGVLAKCHECGGKVRVQLFDKAQPPAEEKSSDAEAAALAEAAAAVARREIDQLMGRVS